MSGSNDDPTLYLALGTCVGVYFFIKGFRVFREYRVVGDTPAMPIRSIPMGLVHVRGKAMGERRVTSPVSGMPCFFYKVEIDRWETKDNSGQWTHYRTDADGVPFHLTDGTGKVVVDAHAAELDLLKAGMRKVHDTPHVSAPSTPPPRSSAGPTDDDLRKYVSEVGVKRLGSMVGRGLDALGPLSDPDKEQKKKAVVEMFTRGLRSPDAVQQFMALQRPLLQRRLEEMGPQSDPFQEQARREAMEAMKYPVGSAEFVERMQRVMGNLHDPQQRQHVMHAVESMTSIQQGGLAAMMPAASGEYRLTEFCIVPDQTYEVTGTCVENPAPQDQHDRNKIVKGQSEPTFLISCRDEKQIESNLRRRAALYIFGGAGVSIVCVAILLFKYGLL
jgi:hypothetical protein